MSASEGMDVTISVVALYPSINCLFRWIEAITTLSNNGGILSSVIVMQTAAEGLRTGFLYISKGGILRDEWPLGQIQGGGGEKRQKSKR